jgi:transcriptional regulator with XRE-family HTH domain
MTLQQLAHALGHSAHGYISELESGKKKPTAELVLKVACLFDVTTDLLLRDEIELDSHSAEKSKRSCNESRISRQ